MDLETDIPTKNSKSIYYDHNNNFTLSIHSIGDVVNYICNKKIVFSTLHK